MSARDRDEISRDLQRERETRIRPIDVRRPDGRGAAYSGGVEIEIHASANTSTTIDTNPAELRAWAEAMLAFADELDGRDPLDEIFTREAEKSRRLISDGASVAGESPMWQSGAAASMDAAASIVRARREGGA